MPTIVADQKLVAYCGLYCGACRSYLAGRCPSCRGDRKAAWCKVRTCCQTNNYVSCANCGMHPDPRDCGFFNNLASRLFALVFRSDRAACVDRIRMVGPSAFSREMAEQGRHTLPR